MAVQVAQSMNKARRDPLRYQAGPMSGRPQDPTLEQQAAAIAKKKAMAKGEEFAMPMLEDTWTKIKTAFSPTSTATSAAPIAEGATMAEVAAGAGGNAIGTVGTGLTEAAAANAATGATGSGMMAGLSAFAPYLIGGYFGGKALGLFNKGGFVKGPLHAAGGSRVFRRGSHSSGSGSSSPSYAKKDLVVPEEFRKNNILEGLIKSMEAFEKNQDVSYRQFGGPLSKVRYKQSGGPVNEEIEVSYGGPLSKGV